jgi:hypothetical protein
MWKINFIELSLKLKTRICQHRIKLIAINSQLAKIPTEFSRSCFI